jgi:hypothetical protein
MLRSSDRLLLFGCLGYAVLLALGAVAVPYDRIAPWLSETGPFEVGALVAWIVAAAVLAIRIRPFTARTLAFAVVCLLCAAREADLHKALLLYAAVVAVRFLFREGGLRSRSGTWLIVSAVLLVATKTLDRSYAVLAGNFALWLPPALQHVTAALEEGLEPVVPLALALSAWISQTERRYLS